MSHPKPPAESVVNELLASPGKNIYQLSKALEWSYGKTERVVTKLLDEQIIHDTYDVVNGRRVRILAAEKEKLPPPRGEHLSSPAMESDFSTLVHAFLELHGIFEELKAVKIDPTKALLARAAKAGKEPGEIIKLLDEARHISLEASGNE